jgi:hypothetical protein
MHGGQGNKNEETITTTETILHINVSILERSW